jgi:thymidine kinase
MRYLSEETALMGHLSLIIGCMFAQKTTELLRRVRRYKSIGYKVLVVNYSADTRYGVNRIASHDEEFEHAVCVDHLGEVDHLARSGEYQVIAVDESQFFPDLFTYVTAWTDHLPLHIVLAGLDGTSERKPFGDLLRLIPHAEEVERLTAFCAVCCNGTVGLFSQYIGAATDEVRIGGAEHYRPVCRKHYLN